MSTKQITIHAAASGLVDIPEDLRVAPMREPMTLAYDSCAFDEQAFNAIWADQGRTALACEKWLARANAVLRDVHWLIRLQLYKR